jgi:hypothetical protein
VCSPTACTAMLTRQVPTVQVRRESPHTHLLVQAGRLDSRGVHVCGGMSPWCIRQTCRSRSANQGAVSCCACLQGNCPQTGPGRNQWCRSCTYGECCGASGRCACAGAVAASGVLLRSSQASLPRICSPSTFPLSCPLIVSCRLLLARPGLQPVPGLYRQLRRLPRVLQRRGKRRRGGAHACCPVAVRGRHAPCAPQCTAVLPLSHSSKLTDCGMSPWCPRAVLPWWCYVRPVHGRVQVPW